MTTEHTENVRLSHHPSATDAPQDGEGINLANQPCATSGGLVKRGKHPSFIVELENLDLNELSALPPANGDRT